MVPERCERFRESVSLGLDGALSAFESALLGRHLRRCPSCSDFAEAARIQTGMLRTAALETPSRPFFVESPSRPRVARRQAASVVGALAFAAAAAVLVLTPSGHQGGGTFASPGAGTRPLFGVYAAQPTAEASFQVARLRVVSPAAADGPVRGYYGLPA